jgi:hypothetical protein
MGYRKDGHRTADPCGRPEPFGIVPERPSHHVVTISHCLGLISRPGAVRLPGQAATYRRRWSLAAAADRSFPKEVAQKQATHFPRLTARNHFRPDFRGWGLDESSNLARPPPRGVSGHADAGPDHLCAYAPAATLACLALSKGRAMQRASEEHAPAMGCRRSGLRRVAGGRSGNACGRHPGDDPPPPGSDISAPRRSALRGRRGVTVRFTRVEGREWLSDFA